MNKQEVIEGVREAAEKQRILIQSIPKEYFEKEIQHYIGKAHLNSVNDLSAMKKQLRPLVTALGGYKMGIYYLSFNEIAVHHFFDNGVETVSFIPETELNELTNGKCTIQSRTITANEVVCELKEKT